MSIEGERAGRSGSIWNLSEPEDGRADGPQDVRTDEPEGNSSPVFFWHADAEPDQEPASRPDTAVREPLPDEGAQEQPRADREVDAEYIPRDNAITVEYVPGQDTGLREEVQPFSAALHIFDDPALESVTEEEPDESSFSSSPTLSEWLFGAPSGSVEDQPEPAQETTPIQEAVPQESEERPEQEDQGGAEQTETAPRGYAAYNAPCETAHRRSFEIRLNCEKPYLTIRFRGFKPRKD